MIDQAKRNSLKSVAGLGVGAVAFATSPNALATLKSNPTDETSKAALSLDKGLAEIQVSTNIASTTNDLEVVLTNTGKEPATITDMTPAHINTARGRFDFNALFDAGEFSLAPGESVKVPIQHHAVALDNSAIDKRTFLLTENLRRNVSIITDGDSLAAITFTDSTRFA